MKVLFNHPRKSSWHLYRVTPPDGKVWYFTGHYGYHFDRSTLPNMRTKGRVDEIPNVVCEGTFSVEDWTFSDRDTGIQYTASESVRMDMLKAFIAGTLRSEGGLMVGRFTFAKEGSRVSLAPYTGKIPAKLGLPTVAEEVPADAPDLSDLVAALPRPGKR